MPSETAVTVGADGFSYTRGRRPEEVGFKMGHQV